jgi:hypothetical protein
MATDFVVFIHGVNTRNMSDFYGQAREMFNAIEKEVGYSPTRELKPIFLYWGDVAKTSITELSESLQGSDDDGKTAKDLTDFATWKKFWFLDLRKNAVLNFVGDAALYLSRGVSVTIIKILVDQALLQLGLDNIQQLQSKPPVSGDEDRLHLVTHSWGTVILFDILFADRWEDPDLEPDILQAVEDLRSCFFGIGKDLDTSDGAVLDIKNFGIPLASLHTMGSPISLFNLINSGEGKNFNLTPKLKEFLKSSTKIIGTPLPWNNYAHPGDPVAYPLSGAMKQSLGKDPGSNLVQDISEFVSIQDIVTTPSKLAQAVNLVPFFPLSLLGGGGAHGSYWKDANVAKNIAKVIKETFP